MMSKLWENVVFGPKPAVHTFNLERQREIDKKWGDCIENIMENTEDLYVKLERSTIFELMQERHPDFMSSEEMDHAFYITRRCQYVLKRTYTKEHFKDLMDLEPAREN